MPLLPRRKKASLLSKAILVAFLGDFEKVEEWHSIAGSSISEDWDHWFQGRMSTVNSETSSPRLIA